MATGRVRTHLDALTGVRAYAALAVLAFHAWLNAGHPALPIGPEAFSVDLSPYAKFGWIGVDVFFVLSGFLLTRVALSRTGPLAAPPRSIAESLGESYGSYLRRRILRVYPAYYACMSVLLVLAVLGVYGRVPDEADMLLHVVMSHNFVERYIVSMNGVFWTLPFEWHFYLLFPLLLWLLRRFGAVALYAGAVVVVLATKAQVIWADDGFGQLLVLIRLDAFCAGMLASFLSHKYPLGRRAAIAAALAGMALLLTLPFVFAKQPGVVHYYDVLGFVKPFWMHAAICLVLCAITATRTAFVRLFDHPAIVWLGTISYSIYLWHLPVVELLPSVGLGADLAAPSWGGYLRLVAWTLAFVIPLSVVSYYTIERPFQRAGARRPDEARASPLRRPVVLLLAWAAALLVAAAILRRL